MLYIPNLDFITEKNMLSQDYTVEINGKPCTVRACYVSDMPFNRHWPGSQRPKDQRSPASFISFYSDETVELKVHCKKNPKNVIIRPISKSIKPSQDGDTVTFSLTENGSYVLELDDDRFALHIFFNAPKEHPDKKEATYYFGPGIHRPLLLNLKDNDSVYIDPEAIVYTTVYAENAKNVRIFGGGVLDNSCQERVFPTCYDKSPIGNIRMWHTDGIVIEDVILLDSSNWILALFNCNNVLIDNIKIVGQWRYNTDGIDITNTSNVKIRNSFVRSFDDTIVIKAIYDHDICENITVENCVLWCGWGKTLELGLETAANEYRNIHFKNCDLIHNSSGAMAISNGCSADIHDIYYENINVEYQKYNKPQVVQTSKAQKYEWDGTPYMDDLIRLTNWRYELLYSGKWTERLEHGHTHDIYYKNINVYTDYDIGKPKLALYSENENMPMENINIENIYLNGKLIESFEGLDMNCQYALNIRYRDEKGNF